MSASSRSRKARSGRAASIDWLSLSAPYGLVAGVDEVGRGPLAGDVVAAAVILPPGCDLPGLDDSKKLTPARCERLSRAIQACAIAWATGRASVAEIDTLNILQASLLAMHRAVAALTCAPEFVLVDGNRSPRWDRPSRAIVSGDARCRSIAAASIIAKVTRDRIMAAHAADYPGYGWEQNRGYPTHELHSSFGQYQGLPEWSL